MKPLVVAALALCATAASAAPHAPRYLVSLTVEQAGRTLVSPSLLVDAGQDATFMKSDKSWWFKLVASPDAAGKVAIAFDSTFARPDGMRHYGTTVNVQAGEAPSVIPADDLRFTISARVAD